MLELFALLTVVLGSGVGVAMGWRILRRARGSRGAPERWMGLALLWICAGGYPMLLVGQLVGHELARFAFVSLGVFSGHVGMACILWFTYRVFRADVGWLRVAVYGAFAALAVTCAGSIAVYFEARSSAEAMLRESEAWGHALNFVSSVGFAWTAFESIRHFGLARRRVRLGLADPLVASRMLLWGLFGAGSLCINLVGLAATLRGVDPAGDAFTVAASSALSLVVTVALWLAFLPPESFVRRVRRGAPGAAAAA
jgi:hypothetical protein